MQWKSFLLLTTTLWMTLLLIGCKDHTDRDQGVRSISPVATPIPSINFTVIKTIPHDTSLFTEGFLVHDGRIFESTGSPDEYPDARSLVGIIDPATGKMDKKIELDKDEYFGEGIAFIKNRLYQLTYYNQKGFIYDATTFKKTGEFTYSSREGWGMTTDSAHLIMDDSSDVLIFLDPSTCKPVKTLKVTLCGAPRDSLNELEYIKGYIYANVWLTDYILKIDTATGKVVGRLDLASIVADARNKNPNADALNGIAYDAITDKIYITGKRWSNIYQLSFPH